jgi:hypothetical protein
MITEPTYLLDTEHKERGILERFDQFLGIFSPFIESLGIAPRYSWYLIQFEMKQFVSDMRGDVDILAGKLEPASQELYEQSLNRAREMDPDINPYTLHHLAAIDLAWKGNLKWIPSLDYLIGIEVKCSYRPRDASAKVEEDDMKSRKSSPGKKREIRQEVEKLLMMGFDKVGLFDFIANPPADGIGSQPWNIASHISGQSMDAMNKILEQRLVEDSPAGHGASSFSGIFGKEEHHAGAYDYPIFREAQINPLLKNEEIKSNRQEMERNLSILLQTFPRPRSTPAIFINKISP